MNPKITILYGGTSNEREVSLRSGKNVADALAGEYDVNLIDLTEDKLPDAVLDKETLVFPVLHGSFGEDGQLQSLLEENDLPYVGCDAISSALCMDKIKTKEVLRAAGVPVLPNIYFNAGEAVNFDALKELDSALIVKPSDQGSSRGLYRVEGFDEFIKLQSSFKSGSWMVEKCIAHREFSVGVLAERSLGIVEICPKEGASFDYDHKYTPGASDFYFPALLETALTQQIKNYSEVAFRACKCRDFARLDLVMDENNNIYFLEINTIPGLTENSLLPKSASCEGFDFKTLCSELVKPGIKRYQNKLSEEAVSV